ncbi:PH and SEC7 domain-containing protein isoform X5 [Galleria mellonella]|uniref:PH and SEC7 domain-containing protein isoform X5 n=1 Tax=Galleria mellonella TaxID=7137 RepID=A0ABM3ME22_GALME|nr:PH and SEC7 domain-containing protein isoform X5 [Galleria mellonella]
MADERLVVLKRSDNLGFGFSLLGEAGLPHIIYEIEENSPAARSGEVEAGDVLLKVNGTDVNRFTTREVLKCLRLSSDPVTLRLKKDPQIKANVRRYLSAAAERRSSLPRVNHDKPSSPPSSNSNSNSNSSSNSSSNGSGVQSGDSCEALLTDERAPRRPRTTQPKFEAYMMTGDLMLNLSRVEHPHHNHHAPTHRTHYHRYNSTPASPCESRACGRAELAQRHNSSPDTGLGHAALHAARSPIAFRFISQPASPAGGGASTGEISSARPPHTVRTSRSEDHLQESSLSAVAVDMEEDVTSSLNTLLDARPDSATPAPRSDSDAERDRIVWTYNAPVSSATERACNGSAATSNSTSTSISDGMSQSRSSSPASPTSVSSSVMSSRATPPHRPPPHPHRPLNGDMSLSEAVSNISSPDYQDQDDMFETGRDCPRMELSDPSDSDSTILVSEPCHKRAKSNSTYSNEHGSDVTLNGDHNTDYRIVIQVKGPDKQNSNTNENVNNNNNNNSNYAQNGKENGHNSPENQGYQELGSGSDGGSDEGSDGDSLHSFHYSPKAVDIPSAERLAKRLYHLDGFKKSDVSRHLSKNNEFSRAVAEEYVRHFSFGGATLDAALRSFLARFALSGETQERERVLVHFSRRYLECNPGSFNSQDAVHTLTCAIMLLNTDLHGGGAGAFRRMSCAEFIDNLADLNDGDNFPRDTLKHLYHAIRTQPLQWALDAETGGTETNASGGAAAATAGGGGGSARPGANPFLDVPDQARAVEYKKGYVMRKCCVDANGKKTPFGRRGWKMFYCTLRDLVLFLHKDEHGFRRNQMSDNLHNAIRIHHALATKATDYTKKQHVFRLQTADQAEYLFQTSDSKELCSWVETINFVCAAYSAPPLAGAVGSQRKFQRPLLPCTHTKLSMREQLAEHEERSARLEEELAALRHARDNSPHARDKEHYLVYEVKRYRTYAYVMRSRCPSGPRPTATARRSRRRPDAPWRYSPPASCDWCRAAAAAAAAAAAQPAARSSASPPRRRRRAATTNPPRSAYGSVTRPSDSRQTA